MRPYRSFADTIPTVSIRRSDGRARPASDLFVVGRVVDIVPGVGMKWSFDNGAEQISYLPFDSPETQVRTMHLVLAVEQAVDSQGLIARPEPVVVGVALDPRVDLAGARAEFADLGRVALPLVAGSAVFAYDPTLYSILEDGGLVATVAEDGSLSLPLLDATEGQSLLQGAPHLDAVLDRSKPVVIDEARET